MGPRSPDLISVGGKDEPYGAVEMAADSHGDLYVVDNASHSIDVYGPGRFLPSVRIAEASTRQPTSAVLNGSVDPEGLSVGECYFEYVTSEAFKGNVEVHSGQEAEGFSDLSSGGRADCSPSASELKVNSEYQVVHADISDLLQGETYYYRLVAATSGSLGGSSESGALAFTTPHAPRIDSTSVANISSRFAELRAEIDPLGGCGFDSAR